MYRKGENLFICEFLGTFAKLRKATVSVVMSIRPSFRLSIHTKKTRLPQDEFWLNWILEIFSKICRENLIPLKSDNNNMYFTWRPMYIDNSISLNSS
jgi:hypothetical protein